MANVRRPAPPAAISIGMGTKPTSTAAALAPLAGSAPTASQTATALPKPATTTRPVVVWRATVGTTTSTGTRLTSIAADRLVESVERMPLARTTAIAVPVCVTPSSTSACRITARTGCKMAAKLGSIAATAATAVRMQRGARPTATAFRRPAMPTHCCALPTPARTITKTLPRQTSIAEVVLVRSASSAKSAWSRAIALRARAAPLARTRCATEP